MLATRSLPARSLAQLADASAIGDVLAAYCEAVDEMQLDALVALFSVDCRFDRGFDAITTGRDDLRAYFAARLPVYSATSHHLSNVRVRVSGDHAQASSYVYACHWFADGRPYAELWGRYADTLRKSGATGLETWLITERKIRAAGAERFPVGDRQPAFEPLKRGS